MGKPQFMPSSYRYYAADFTGNPKKDLMNDDAAVIASVANYFHKHGWQMNQGIAQPAIVEGARYKKINTSYKTAVYRLNQLIAAGIKPLTASVNTPAKVGLIELTTQTGQEFLAGLSQFLRDNPLQYQPTICNGCLLIVTAVKKPMGSSSHWQKIRLRVSC